MVLLKNALLRVGFGIGLLLLLFSKKLATSTLKERVAFGVSLPVSSPTTPPPSGPDGEVKGCKGEAQTGQEQVNMKERKEG